jgi:threonine dehydratase
LKGKKIVCVVSGGNIDVTILSRVIKRGLLTSGRSCSLAIELLDQPGQLVAVSKIIADNGGNVISVHHERDSEAMDINECVLRLVLETKNFEHIATIKRALRENGYTVSDGNL